MGLVERVTGRMRRAGRIGRTVVLRLRFADYTRATRSHTLAGATADTEAVLTAIRRLAADARPLTDARGLTMVGVAVSNLGEQRCAQLALPLDGSPREAREPAHDGDLDRAVDDVRERYGTPALTRATLLGRDRGLEMPHLPD